MTRQETLMIMAVLKAAYPGYYKDTKQAEIEMIVSLWQEMLPEPYEIVAAAVKALICTDEKGFPPNIGRVKEKIRLLTVPEGRSELEAWALVRKAIQNSGYNSGREFEALPETVKAAVGNAAALKEWAMLPPNEVETVTQSNFLRSYRAKAKHAAEVAALPETVKQFMTAVSDKLKLEGTQ